MRERRHRGWSAGPASQRIARSAWLLALVAWLLLAIPTAAQSPDASPSVGETLEPGRHTWDAVGPPISMEVGEGWREREAIEGPILTFERPDMPGGVLTITRFDGDAFADSCDPSSITWVQPSAERLIEIIRLNPFLVAQEAEPIEVGGLAGRSLDVVTPPFTPAECRLVFLLIWAIGMEDGEFVQVPGQAARFIAVDVGPDTIVFAIETLPGMAFEPFAAEAMELVGSVSFDRD